MLAFLETSNLTKLFDVSEAVAKSMQEKASKDENYAKKLVNDSREKKCMNFCKEIGTLFITLSDPERFSDMCEYYAERCLTTPEKIKEKVLFTIEQWELTGNIPIYDTDESNLFDTTDD